MTDVHARNNVAFAGQPDGPVVMLAPGDTLFLYTDGLTYARVDSTGGRYGSEALLQHARALAPASASEIVAATSRLLDTFGDGLDDDAAILALTVEGASR